MPTDERKDEVPETEEKPVKKGGVLAKWIIIGVVLLAIIAGAVAGGVFFFRSSESVAKKPPAQPAAVIGTLWPMEPFIVNLRDNNGERYLKVIMQLEVSQSTVVSELDLLKPKLRDNSLDLLASKTFQELQELNGKQKLRDDLMMRMNSFLTSGKIVRVYFTEFVIQ